MRNKKLLAVILAASMAFSMNAFTFASEPEVQAATEIEVVGIDSVSSGFIVSSVSSELSSVGNKEDKNDENYEIKATSSKFIGMDTEKYFSQIPSGWDVNSDPGTWSTATKIVSGNGSDGSGWTVYSPFAYFFGDDVGNNHIISGKLVGVDWEDDIDDEEEVVYKAIKAGDAYVLVRYATDVDLPEYYVKLREDKDGKIITDEINKRYNGNEPIVTYSGAKHAYNNIFFEGKNVNPTKNKKNQDRDIYADIVLVKYDSSTKTTSIIKGLSVKDLIVKNDVAASVSADEIVTPKTGAGYDGYVEKKDGTIEYLGFDSSPQLKDNKS
ncbi:MAG: hypothetical protein J6P05_03845, partial [Lachnospiraceae bacterium]|nr:hypothetical protein [Lachnospiraceae bacterium]